VVHLSSPHLIAFDPEGNWELSELIRGESLEKFLARGGRPSAELRASIRRIFEQAVEMKHRLSVTLDLAPDNLLIVGERVVLVDLGPISTPSTLAENFERTMTHWESLGARCALELSTVSAR
jgi:tRNA A-37 threonylcarbamoyl transferase component Bud32